MLKQVIEATSWGRKGGNLLGSLLVAWVCLCLCPVGECILVSGQTSFYGPFGGEHANCRGHLRSLSKLLSTQQQDSREKIICAKNNCFQVSIITPCQFFYNSRSPKKEERVQTAKAYSDLPSFPFLPFSFSLLSLTELLLLELQS